MSELLFWHEQIGSIIGAADENTMCVSVPTRLKRGIGDNRLGAGIDAFYIACEGDSYLVSKTELPNTKGLRFVPSEDFSGERFIARWLAESAPTDRPWLVGVISKANPNSSLAFSQPPYLCVYCQANKGFEFNLSDFRADVELSQGIDWKMLAQAIYAYDDFISYDSYRKEKGSKSLEKLFKREPELKKILPKLKAKPNNGEHTLLSWYNRAR